MYYQLTSYGYMGEKAYLDGENKMSVTIGFQTLEDALNKKKQFELWAEMNNIPPYEITIEEVLEKEDINEPKE